jgi:hypothetical protein
MGELKVELLTDLMCCVKADGLPPNVFFFRLPPLCFTKHTSQNYGVTNIRVVLKGRTENKETGNQEIGNKKRINGETVKEITIA